VQPKHLGLAVSLLLTLCVCPATQAQQAGPIKSMKLLTTDTGWAATDHKLFWTTDGGAHWKDITPKLNHERQSLSSVFFIDSSIGWAVLRCGDDRDPKIDDVCFDLASTSDAGENWSVVHLKVADPDPEAGFSGGTRLDFADPLHGWMVLQVNRSVSVSFGMMYKTQDGGKSWDRAPLPPVAGEPRFVNLKDGWLGGGPSGDIYVTHDAGNSWQEVSLPKPATVGPDTGADLSLPAFENARHGFLSVRYAVGPLMGPDLSAPVLFATNDGGQTWKQDRVIPVLPVIYSSDLVGSVLIAAHSEQAKTPQKGGTYQAPKTRLTLYAFGADLRDTSNSAEISSQGAAIDLSFVDRERGWANLSDKLFSTEDAGKTWVDVTPGVLPHALTPPPSFC
jgi:photosystem II stability/assembly factor-like uncharacterized protein